MQECNCIPLTQVCVSNGKLIGFVLPKKRGWFKNYLSSLESTNRSQARSVGILAGLGQCREIFDSQWYNEGANNTDEAVLLLLLVVVSGLQKNGRQARWPSYLKSLSFVILFSSRVVLFLFCTHTNQSSPEAILRKVTAVYLNYLSLILFPSFSDRHMFNWCIRNRCTYCLPSCRNWGLDNTSCSDSCIIFEIYLTSVALIFYFNQFSGTYVWVNIWTFL